MKSHVFQHGLSLSNEKELVTKGTWESRNQYAEQKKSDTTENIQYNSMYTKL